MALSNAVVALVLLGLAACAVVFASRPRGGEKGLLPVAHAERLTALPEFARSVRRARRRVVAGAAALALAGAAALVGVARPVETLTQDAPRHTRDVILCLDASGSMSGVNAEILAEYDTLVEGFDGERIGLTVFNSSALQVFPLTDDYELARRSLSDVRLGFASYGSEGKDVLAGTFDGAGSSLIGDGLAACVSGFDERDRERSRSIVFATDNFVAGTPLFTLPEATALARDEGIRVYVLAPMVSNEAVDQRTAELLDAAEETGGTLYSLDDVDAGEIVTDIQSTQASLVRGETTTRQVDRSAVPLTLTTLAVLAAYFVLWRLRL